MFLCLGKTGFLLDNFLTIIYNSVAYIDNVRYKDIKVISRR
jgi:hypothetical protein